MRRLACALFGHRNITYVTWQWGVGLTIGAACLRCYDTAAGDVELWGQGS